jgi:hypothetical protein
MYIYIIYYLLIICPLIKKTLAPPLLIHKRKGKRKTGNKKEHIVPVLISDMTFKMPSHNNTSEPLRAFKPTASISHALYRFLIRT